jgi:hypothetical protein
MKGQKIKGFTTELKILGNPRNLYIKTNKDIEILKDVVSEYDEDQTTQEVIESIINTFNIEDSEIEQITKKIIEIRDIENLKEQAIEFIKQYTDREDLGNSENDYNDTTRIVLCWTINGEDQEEQFTTNIEELTIKKETQINEHVEQIKVIRFDTQQEYLNFLQVMDYDDLINL